MKKENTNSRGIAYYQSIRAKYLNLAKEAASSGDRVLSEYNMQFAEHYGRMITEKQEQQAEAQKQLKAQVKTQNEPDTTQTQQNNIIEREQACQQATQVIRNKASCRRPKTPTKNTVTETVS